MRMEPDLQRSGGIYLELQRMKKKSNFPLRMDGKTLEKTGIHLWEISKGRGDLSGAPENEEEE